MLRTISGLLALTSLSLGQAPTVDLGYSVYEGAYDTSFDQNLFYGIRFAQAPIGELRWQAPRAPLTNRTATIPATAYGSQCPQTPPAPGPADASPSGDEDCLFINVIAPANKSGLPVFFWIHGGGYGAGNGQFDLRQQISTNNNSYIAVTTQYRLGAFGFLSSNEVAAAGLLNAGLHDQRFALQWVQDNIEKFGGDPTRVTIAGESAGGGSVMLQGIANGGTEGTALFQGGIAGSPYLPTQWKYNAGWPQLSYDRLVDATGCSTAKDTFSCLVGVDTVTLQTANGDVTVSSNYGQWAFIPVTDGRLIRKRPAEQLALDKATNGNQVLVGQNENEGVIFCPQNITTQDDFEAFVLTNYPNLSAENMTSILALYAVPANASTLAVDSDGLNAPFSTTNSNFGVGWQQAVNNLYAETTFVCPAYWMGDGYSGNGKSAYRYQYSVPPASHGAELTSLTQTPSAAGNQVDETFTIAFQQIWGNFVVNGSPALSSAQVTAAVTDCGNITAAITWPTWGGTADSDAMLVLNVTGGQPTVTPDVLDGVTINLVTYEEPNTTAYPSLEAEFLLVNGYTFEGNRGDRCALWLELGAYDFE
ncbi:carboxylesterase [Xylariaceae sp. FL0255]|nr:carboxylesterase [Xylariaceae sp. FL0255]